VVALCPSQSLTGGLMDSRVAVVVEDDDDIREVVCTVLTQSGFRVHTAATGIEGVEAVREHRPDVVTLDLSLPDIDGFEVARRVRLFSDSYIIMVTARTDELDTLQGLDSGADDYITKPFRPRELRARVSALLRRPRGGGYAPGNALDPAPARPAGASQAAGSPAAGESQTAGPSAQKSGAAPGKPGNEAPVSPAAQRKQARSQELEHNGLRLDPGTRTLEIDGSEVDLTRTEFDLLQVLMESGRIVRTKADLARSLRSREYDTGVYISEADERVVEVHVGNLRRKLGDSAKDPRWVETVRGIGYRMAPVAIVQKAAANR
jgi:two-component system, OmpR family, response regulator